MLDIGVSNKSTEKVNIKSSLTDFPERTNGHNGTTRMMRKFVNSAIYIEKPLSVTVSTESCSIQTKCSTEDIIEPKVKRCTCSVDQKTCPCHRNSFFTFIPKDDRGNSSASCVTLKVSESKVKISQCSSSCTSDDDKKNLLKKWIAKKEEEKRKKEMEAKMILEAKSKEKQMIVEQEKNNFQKWLFNKKKMEMEAKKKKERDMEGRQLKELEKEKRQLENQLKFQLWVKKKEEAQLEKKIRKQVELINELERKERQMKENDRAFKEWLKNSKNKQKPVPLNKGIETMCSSSVTYVNPNPWKSAA